MDAASSIISITPHLRAIPLLEQQDLARRKPNFTELEKSYLIEQYELYKSILSVRRSVGNQQDLGKKKTEIWAMIANGMREMNPNVERTPADLRKKWKNLVAQARKELIDFSQQQQQDSISSIAAVAPPSTMALKVLELTNRICLQRTDGEESDRQLLFESDSDDDDLGVVIKEEHDSPPAPLFVANTTEPLTFDRPLESMGDNRPNSTAITTAIALAGTGFDPIRSMASSTHLLSGPNRFVGANGNPIRPNQFGANPISPIRPTNQYVHPFLSPPPGFREHFPHMINGNPMFNTIDRPPPAVNPIRIASIESLNPISTAASSSNDPPPNRKRQLIADDPRDADQSSSNSSTDIDLELKKAKLRRINVETEKLELEKRKLELEIEYLLKKLDRDAS